MLKQITGKFNQNDPKNSSGLPTLLPQQPVLLVQWPAARPRRTWQCRRLQTWPWWAAASAAADACCRWTWQHLPATTGIKQTERNQQTRPQQVTKVILQRALHTCFCDRTTFALIWIWSQVKPIYNCPYLWGSGISNKPLKTFLTLTCTDHVPYYRYI